jgi:hypothetical protein
LILEASEQDAPLPQHVHRERLLTTNVIAQRETKGSDLDFDPTSASGDNFLARERAALGDDAGQFSSGNDNAAFVEDGDDDLLGGGGGESDFQSSFPEIDTRNEVNTSSHQRWRLF